MKVPKYIQEHIEANNKLLLKASRHADIVMGWYEAQLEKLNSLECEIDDEEFFEVMTNWLGNGEIDIQSIKENLSLLENYWKESI